MYNIFSNHSGRKGLLLLQDGFIVSQWSSETTLDSEIRSEVLARKKQHPKFVVATGLRPGFKARDKAIRFALYASVRLCCHPGISSRV